jgi:DNA recombination protein RmuC
MMTVTIILSIVCLLLLVLVAWQLKSGKSVDADSDSLKIEVATKNSELESLKSQLNEAKRKNESDSTSIQKLMAENAVLSRQVQMTESLQKQAELQFKELADKILDEKAKKLKDSSETRLSEILDPLKQNIDGFKKIIEDRYMREAEGRVSLKTQIDDLVKLNQDLGKEAKDLTQALKGGSKIQGDWGEMKLESILEASGLTKGLEYDLQVTRDADGSLLKSEQGAMLRPDAVVHFPGHRNIVIDSKVSLTNFVNSINADSEEQRQMELGKHVESVRSHIKELKVKKYQDIVPNSTDFVLMFIPMESAYIAAMTKEPKLAQEALDSRVVIVSPTHLISLLKIDYQLWSTEKQTKNALKIADEAGKMLGKFTDFVTDMEAIRKGLASSQNAYDKAMNKLHDGKGNLIDRARGIQELGVRTAKQLPESSADA